jgi:hypothetical protein
VKATTGYAIYRNNGTINITGGLVFAYGAGASNVIYGTYSTTSGNPAIIAWSNTDGTTYSAFSSTALSASPSPAAAQWLNKDGKAGIDYSNGTNTGFFELPVTVNKIAPTGVTFPTASGITYNPATTLSQVPLVGGSSSGTFAWQTGTEVPTVVNSGYNAVFTPTDAENYTTLTQSVALSVAKSNAITTGVPEFQYARQLKAATYEFHLVTLLPEVHGLTGVSYSPAITANADGVIGTLAYTSGDKLNIPVNSSALGKTGQITVTISSDNYNNFTAVITVEVVDKYVFTGTIAISGWTYGGTASNPVISGTPSDYDGEIIVEYKAFGAGDATYSKTKPATAGDYEMRVTWAETDDYMGYVEKEEFVIAKANPSVTAPTGLTSTVGKTLADVALPAGWAWESAGTTLVGAAGTQTHKAKFTPTDLANYNVITGIDLQVTVSEPTPIRTPQIAGSSISVHAKGNSIVLQNLPAGARVEVFDLRGRGVACNALITGTTTTIPMQTKGMYIVKTGTQIFRLAVK